MSQPSTPNLPIPSRVGNYQLLKTIGKGQFGYVKLATHELTREKVAIKVIQKNRLDEKTLKMVSREISIMKLLSHPNVIRLYEVIETEIFLFLVMEYAAGGEIMDFIVTHGKLKERDARRIFRQVVEAIDYCHEVHVIHRDLKAENLLLDSQFGIKLIDFGLSNRWAPGEFLKTFCGSPTYTAPELIKRQQYEGPEVDLWSMGVLLYVLVSGSLPFDGNTFLELFTKIINGVYQVPDHVSPECRDLIGRLLVVNPKQRATLDQVRDHPWIKEGGNAVPKANLQRAPLPENVEDLDEDILNELVSVGYERDYAIQAVMSNSYDDAAGAYFLLVEAKKRRGPPAPAPVRPTVHAQVAQLHPVSLPPSTVASPIVPSNGHKRPPSAPQNIAFPPPISSSESIGRAASPSKPPLQDQEEYGNPAMKGQPRRERSDTQRHRRHHTVGTPGEFPVDEPPPNAQRPPTNLAPPTPNAAPSNQIVSPSHKGSARVDKPITEEDEMEHDVIVAPLTPTIQIPNHTQSNQTSSSSAKSSRPTKQIVTPVRSSSPAEDDEDEPPHRITVTTTRPSRPTGGLQPRSATMRAEKSRHKESKKKGHQRRTSLEPDEEEFPIPNASSSKDLKKSSDKQIVSPVTSGTPSPTPSAPKSGRRGSRPDLPKLPTVLTGVEDDNHIISLNAGSPPTSPNSKQYFQADELRASQGSNPNTPLKSNKKESKSMFTSVKKWFTRKEPRQVRFSMNENNTTHESPDVVLAKLVEVLKSMELQSTTFLSPYCIKTETDTAVALEVEICQAPFVHLYGVRFRRICGDAWQYTRVCKKILDLLDLNNSGKSASLPSTAAAASSSSSTSQPSSPAPKKAKRLSQRSRHVAADDNGVSVSSSKKSLEEGRSREEP